MTEARKRRNRSGRDAALEARIAPLEFAVVDIRRPSESHLLKAAILLLLIYSSVQKSLRSPTVSHSSHNSKQLLFRKYSRTLLYVGIKFRRSSS